MIDKKVLEMTMDLYKSSEEKKRKNIKVSFTPKVNKAKDTSAPEKKSLKSRIVEFINTIADGFSYDKEILNGEEASKAIRMFIVKTLGVVALYIIAFTFIIVIPLKRGYWLSTLVILPMIVLSIGAIAFNEIKLYGEYIIPVKRYCEYKKNSNNGLFN